jgi:hypothetical protein
MLPAMVVILTGMLCAIPTQTIRAKKATGKNVYFVWEERSDGLFSLSATSIAIDPKDPKRLYAAASGIFYRSQNGGMSWRPTARFVGSARTQVQRVDLTEEIEKLKQQILEEKLEDLEAEVGEERAKELETTLELEAEEEAEDQISQQRREGSGEDEERGRFQRRIYRIAVSPHNPKLIAVATDGGLFLSKDGGNNFEQIFRGRASGEGDVRTVIFDPHKPSRIWAGSQVGLWYSPDGGSFWRRGEGELGHSHIQEILFDPTEPKRIYIATNRSFFVSNNQGQSFLKRWSITTGNVGITSLTILNTRPTSAVLATSSGLYISSTMQNFSRLISAGIGNPQITYVTSNMAEPTWIYVISENGVFISRNKGKNFTQMREGMLASEIRYLLVSPHDSTQVWAATDYGVLLWSRIIGGKITSAQWHRFQRDLKREPTPWMVSNAALRFMSINQDLDNVHQRSYWSGWLPRLNTITRLYLDKRDTLIMLPNKNQPIQLTEGRAFLFEVNMSWNLESLIASREQVNVYRDTRAIRDTKHRLMRQVLRLYHARRRLMLQLFVSPPRTLPLYLRMQLRLQEITAQLDGMTGGYLARRISSSKRKKLRKPPRRK